MTSNMTSSLSPSRVRYDPLRSQGNANHVALGRGPIDATVVSSTEVQRWEDMLRSQEIAQASRDELKAKSDASKARMATWTDTLEAKRRQYIVDRNTRLEAEERRRQMLDAEEAEYQETKRHQRLEDAQRQLIERDERGRNMRSQLLLHAVLEERKGQIALLDERRQVADQDEKEFAEAVRLGAVQEIEDKKMLAQLERERSVNVKRDQKDMLDSLIQQRREARKTAVLDLEALKKAAEEERQENSQQRAQRRQAEHALRMEQVRQMSPVVSPRQVNLLKSQTVHDTEAQMLEAYYTKKQIQQQQLQELRQSKSERHETRVSKAGEALERARDVSCSPRERAVDLFSSVPSFAERLTEQSYLREKTMAQHKRDATFASPRSKGLTAVERTVQELHSPAYRERLNRQIAMMDRFDEEQRMQQKEEDKYVAMVQRLQAAEKRKQFEMEREAELEEVRRRAEGLAAEDALFHNFIQSQLPSNLPPRNAARALGVSSSPRHVVTA